MNTKAVRDKVQAWVAGVLGITTIHGFQNAKAPAEPYASIHRVMSDRVIFQPAGIDYVEQGGSVEAVPLAETYYRFTVDVFGPDAEDYLQRLVAAADVPTAMWPLRPLILFETSRIVTNFEIRDQEFKDRAQMTIEVRGIPRDGVEIDVIATQEPEFEPVD